MRRTPTRGNQHGCRSSYEKQKGMALHKEYIEREKGKIPIIAMYLWCVTSLINSLPSMKRLQKRKNGRMLLSRNISRS